MSHTSMPEQTKIIIDGKVYAVEATQLSGTEIRAIAARAPQYQVFCEQEGNKADLFVVESEKLKIREGMKFYTVPPAMFG